MHVLLLEETMSIRCPGIFVERPTLQPRKLFPGSFRDLGAECFQNAQVLTFRFSFDQH